MLSASIALATVFLMTLACIGLGAMALRACAVLPQLDRLEASAWAFGLGFGVLGWGTFFLGTSGWLGNVPFLILLFPAFFGLICLRHARSTGRLFAAADSRVLLSLLLALSALAAVDLLEGLSPPADADSLAYHFALPKQFLSAGRVEFMPRGADGAIPLLVQMTWMAALDLGGEQAMTLWAGVSGWMTGFLLFAVSRRYMSDIWSLVVTFLFLSSPVVLYGGGNGQVEVRLALFAMLGAFALLRGIHERSIGFVAIAALATGFCVATKYTGLLFAASEIVVLLIFWRSPKALTIFAGLAVVTGFQWYGWNWWHTGDPIFPVLHGLLGLPDNDLWTAEQDAIFRSTHAGSERPLPISIFWLTAFPFHATLWPISAIESGRTGFGAYGLAILPFVAMGVWQCRNRLRHHPLTIIVAIAVLFYVFWFFSGVSQRVRHLLPIWPLLIICATAISLEWSRDRHVTSGLAAAAVFCGLIQLAGQLVFGASYFRYFSGESREAFLLRSVPYYEYVAPTEAEMGPDDRVLIDQRQLAYLFDRPVFYYHDVTQAMVVARNARQNSGRVMSQLRKERITLLLVSSPVGTNPLPSDLALAAHELEAAGCARSVANLSGRPFGSRTLHVGESVHAPAALYRITEAGCRL